MIAEDFGPVYTRARARARDQTDLRNMLILRTLRVSASASVQSARRHLEGISGIRREVPTTRMGVCGRALRVAAGAPRAALRLLGYARWACAGRLSVASDGARDTPAATDAKIYG